MRKFIATAMMALSLNMGLAGVSFAQDAPSAGRPVEMADTFRQEGKIYVVVAIIGVILGGIFIYAIRIDQKIGKLEEEWEGHRTGNENE